MGRRYSGIYRFRGRGAEGAFCCTARNGRMNLTALQKAFAKAVYLSKKNPEELLHEIIPGGSLDVKGALGVYQNGYPARLTEQLGETFEAVWWVLGDEDFLTVCRTYIAENGSQSY